MTNKFYWKMGRFYENKPSKSKLLTTKEVLDILNKLDAENKELRLLVDTLKEQNMKFRLRLKDLGVEY